MPKKTHGLAAVIVAVVFVGAAWPSTAHLQDGYDALREQLHGTWALADSVEDAERTRDRAAERAASAMNVFVRGIASSRLREGSHVNRRITLSFADDRRIAVRFDESRYASELGETVRVTRSDGARLRLTQRIREGKLEQVFQSESGTRWYVYEPTGAGAMRLSTTTNSDRMPQPMHFVLDYRRR